MTDSLLYLTFLLSFYALKERKKHIEISLQYEFKKTEHNLNIFNQFYTDAQ